MRPAAIALDHSTDTDCTTRRWQKISGRARATWRTDALAYAGDSTHIVFSCVGHGEWGDIMKEEAENRIDFTSLASALGSLKRAVDRAMGVPDDEEVRDAVIQRFEYTFELAWKMIKRQVEMESAVPSEIDTLSFRSLIREAAEKGIIQSFEPWMVYREQRNITSHTYNQDKAESVFETAKEFLPVAQKLLADLRERPL
jgi:nucleotidyltransferase substrate binding protein (TIGR01987 family)